MIVNDLQRSALRCFLFGFIYFTIFTNRFDFCLGWVYLLVMENENDSLARTAHAYGITDVEFTALEGLPPAQDIPMPPPLPEGVRPLPKVENSPSELDDLVLEFWEPEDRE